MAFETEVAAIIVALLVVSSGASALFSKV